MKNKWKIVIAVVMTLTLLLSACSADNATKSFDETAETAETATAVIEAESATVDTADFDSITVKYSDADIDDTYDESMATHIMLSNGATTVTGDGVGISGDVVTITEAGVYILSGTLSDGQMIVDVAEEDLVQLVLDNASVTNSAGSAIFVKQADQVVITLPEGTQNTVSDSARVKTEDSEDSDDETDDNAAIYASDDLTINGTGQLSVIGNYKHGIKTENDLTITGGQVSITAVKDGLRGKDSVAILDGKITVTAGEDGIKSSNGDEENTGWVSIDGGQLSITAGENGLTAETVLLVTSGDVEITAGQDSLHSNGSIKISDGTVMLSAGDDGAHADNTLWIAGGELTISESYEALEGADVAISGGLLILNAMDDGINAAGGSDSDGLNMGGGNMPENMDAVSGDSEETDGAEEMPDRGNGISEGSRPEWDGGTADRDMPSGEMPQGRGGDSFGGSGDYLISISGGYVYVNVASGDGVDSNGDIAISGGTLVVDGPSNDGNAAIDIEPGSFSLSGGILASAGSSGMLVTPTEAAQPVVTVVFDSQQSAGQAVTLLDSQGNILFSMVPDKAYQSIEVSSPELALGETYQIAFGGRVSGETLDGALYTLAALKGADQTVSFVLSDSILMIDQNGEETTYTSRMGGGRNGGGIPGQH